MRRRPGLLSRLGRLFRRRAKLPLEEQQAVDLIAAIDGGGVPLNPARINQIARNLGLEVSPRAPMDETIERIRAALGRIA